MVIASPKPSLLAQAWQINKPLTALLVFCATTFILSILGLFIDPRVTELVGTPAWAKTFKFSTSLMFYAASLIWALSLLENRFKKIAGFGGSVVGSVFILQMILIIIQAVRIQPLHFNTTTPLDSALWGTMAIANSLMLLGYLILVVMAWRGIRTNPVLAWSIRLSFVVTLFGLLQGFLMTSPNPIQEKALASGQTTIMIGAHTVGSSSLMPDAGAGLPLLGWSTTHGDLRIAHFVGLHALQLLPLFAFWLLGRRQRWLTDRHSMVLLTIAALGYSGLIYLLTWQAGRGQSIVAPDITTLTAFLGLIGAVLLASFGVLAHARAKI